MRTEELPEFKKSEIIRLFNEGYNVKDLSAIFNVHFSMVESVLREGKLINERKRRNEKKERIRPTDMQVIELYKNGYSVGYLTTKYKISFLGVQNVLRKNKLLKSEKKNRELMVEIQNMYVAGKSVKDISDFLNKSPSAIYGYLSKSSRWKKIKGKYHKMDLETKRNLFRYFKKGYSIKKIAEKLNVSYFSIFNYLNKNPDYVKMRAQRNESIKKIKELLKSGKTVNEIINETSFPYQQVYQIKRKYFITD